MTISNRELWSEYESARDRGDTIAHAADTLTGELINAAKNYRDNAGAFIKAAHDDRAAELEIAVYKYLRDSQS